MSVCHHDVFRHLLPHEQAAVDKSLLNNPLRIRFLRQSHVASSLLNAVAEVSMSGQTTANKSILVVDDDAEILKALSKTLTKEHYSVAVASNATEALAHIQRGEVFDLVVTDLSMPGQGGLALIESIRKLVPKVQFIVLTAFGDLANRSTAMSLGVSEFLSKPPETSQLLLSIRRALEK